MTRQRATIPVLTGEVFFRCLVKDLLDLRGVTRAIPWTLWTWWFCFINKGSGRNALRALNSLSTMRSARAELFDIREVFSGTSLLVLEREKGEAGGCPAERLSSPDVVAGAPTLEREEGSGGRGAL